MTTCKICGKRCKNKKGLSIHFGHMHSVKRKFDEKRMLLLEQKIKSLEIRIEEMQPKMNSIKRTTVIPTVLIGNDSDNGDNNCSPKLFGMNYGEGHGELMDELKNVLKTRLVS